VVHRVIHNVRGGFRGWGGQRLPLLNEAMIYDYIRRGAAAAPTRYGGLGPGDRAHWAEEHRGEIYADATAANPHLILGRGDQPIGR